VSKPETIFTERAANEKSLEIDSKVVCRLIADAYREASLADANMSRAVELLEGVRSAMPKMADCFDVFDALDEKVGLTTDDDQLCSVLQNLRTAYVDTVIAALTSELQESVQNYKQTGSQHFVRLLAAALGHWRKRLVFAIARVKPPGTESDPVLANLSECIRYLEQNQPAYITEFLRDLSRLAGVDLRSRVKLLVAAARIETNQFENSGSAGHLLAEASSLTGEDADVIAAYGEYWLQLNENDKAREAFAKSIELNPLLAEPHAGMGELLARESKLTDAERQCNEAIRVEPGSLTGYYGCMKLYNRPELFKDHVDRLRLLVKRALIVEPDESASIYMFAGKAFQKNANYEEAHSYYSMAINAEPSDSDGYFCAGRAYMEQRDYTKAEELFRQAIDCAPNLSMPYCDLGMLYEEQERFAEALNCYDQARERWSPWPWRTMIATLSAEMRWKLERREEACRDLLQLLEQQPANAALLAKLQEFARSYDTDLEDRESAESILTRIREIKGVSYEGDYRNQIGDMYFAAAEYEHAAEQYVLARETSPTEALYVANHAFALNAQGITHFERGEYGEAVKLYKAASTLQPNDDVFYSNLALALELSGTPAQRIENIRAAIEALRRAQELSPEKIEYAQRLESLEDSRALVTLGYGDSALASPAATPIVVEVGDALVPKVDPGQDQGVFLFKLVPDLSSRIESETGVFVPPLRMRGGYEIPKNAITIFLNETPFQTIAISVDAEGPVLAEAIERVLRQNFAMFVGLEEAERIITNWLAGSTVPESVRVQMEDEGFRFGLCRLLRTLARERVPIGDSGAICNAIEGHSLAPPDIPECIRLVRLRIKDALPGNQPGVQRVRLSMEIESRLTEALNVSATRYNLDPELAHEVLQQITSIEARIAGPCALVVADSTMRHLVTRLIEYQLPEMPVLSQEELIPIDRVPDSGADHA
jgi:tetratricopeptide (TPR) repeat protein